MSAAKQSIRRYIPADFSLIEFPGDSLVVDVGCCEGRHLIKLRARGCRVVGVEPDPARIAECHARGFDVRQGFAEHLPLDDRCCDGVVCSVVLPLTDERAAVAEWARVLRPGGEVRASYHGFGYPLHQLLKGPSLATRFYGLRTMINTWFYRLTGRRLPGWFGDTLYQASRRMDRYYRELGFVRVAENAGKSFCGFPVFIFHHLRRAPDPEPRRRGAHA
jgi:SAM-dependent methyltransferase